MDKIVKFGPRKREVQRELAKDLEKTKLYKEGQVISFAGADPEEYIKILLTHNIGNSCILYERNSVIYKKACQNISKSFFLNDIRNYKYQILNKDLFSKPIICKNISGIDLDFCETLREDLSKLVKVKLVELITKTQQNNIWIRVTSSLGPGTDKISFLLRIKKIKEYIDKQTNWSTKKIKTCLYRDTRPMIVWQIEMERIMKKDINFKNTGKVTKKVTKNEMIRALLIAGFTSQDIANSLTLPISTVRAIKAHITMGTYK